MQIEALAWPSLADCGAGDFVLLAARDLKAGEDADDSLRRRDRDVAPIHLDLTDLRTIQAAFNEFDQ